MSTSDNQQLSGEQKVRRCGALKFTSVDRESERDNIEGFLKLADSNRNNVLWIHGGSGCGKSHLAEWCRRFLTSKLSETDCPCCFFEEMKKREPTCKVICVRQEDISGKDFSYLIAFVHSLEEEFDIKLSEYEMIGYRGVKEHLGRIVVTAAATCAKPYFDAEKFEQKSTPISKSLENNAPRQRAISALLEKMVSDGLDAGYRICVILDAFDECDELSFNVLARLLQAFDGRPRIKMIVVTNDDNEGDRAAKKLLQGFLGKTLSRICPFETVEPFYQILTDLVSPDIDKSTLRSLSCRLNEDCGGNPAVLWDALDKLIRAELLEYVEPAGRFTFDFASVVSFLDEKERVANRPFSLRQYYRDYGIVNNLVQLTMLKIIAIQGFALDFENESSFLAKALDEYLGGRRFVEDVSDQLDLLLYSVLEETPDGTIALSSRQAAEAIEENVRRSPRDRLCYWSLRCVFAQELEGSQRKGGAFGLSWYESIKLIATYSFYARDDTWIEDNDCALLAALKQGCLLESLEFANRFIELDSFSEFEPRIACGVSESLFRNGLYNNALPILVELLGDERCENSLSREEIAHAWYLRGCCEHSTLMLDRSVSSLERAMSLLSETDCEYHAALSAKISIMRAFPEHENEAKLLFDDALSECPTKGYGDQLYPLLKLAFFYRDGEEARSLSQCGCNAARRNGDLAACGAFEISLGALSLQSNEFEDARSHFEEASMNFAESSPHDNSYALNDVAVAYMYEGRYRKAHATLLHAQYWSETNYALAAVGVNRMMCELHLSNADAFRSLAEENARKWLSDSNGSDPLTHRRVLINLILGYYHLGDLDEARRYASLLMDCSSIPNEQSMSWYRYNYIKMMILGEIDELPTVSDGDAYHALIDCEPFILLSCHS